MPPYLGNFFIYTTVLNNQGFEEEILYTLSDIFIYELKRSVFGRVFDLPLDEFAYNFINHPDRLKTPLIKRKGIFEEATWDEAFDVIVSKMKDVKASHGSDAFAALSSARCTTEDNYVLQKLFRGVLGTNSVDHCARL